MACLILSAAAGMAQERDAASATSERLLGSYRIEGSPELEASGIHHYFYLHPEGFFLLAADWPGNETSRFAGEWSVSGSVLSLAGRGHVETNQGDWETPFRRSFTIAKTDGGKLRLDPVLEKNRYGLLGWPTPFIHHSRDPRPAPPRLSIPDSADAIIRIIRSLLAQP